MIKSRTVVVQCSHALLRTLTNDWFNRSTGGPRRLARRRPGRSAILSSITMNGCDSLRIIIINEGGAARPTAAARRSASSATRRRAAAPPSGTCRRTRARAAAGPPAAAARARRRRPGGRARRRPSAACGGTARRSRAPAGRRSARRAGRRPPPPAHPPPSPPPRKRRGGATGRRGRCLLDAQRGQVHVRVAVGVLVRVGFLARTVLGRIDVGLGLTVPEEDDEGCASE